MLYEHDFKHQHHDHLICTECGALIEFFSETIENMQDEIVRAHRFVPSSHSLRIFGSCWDCQVRARKAEH
jgi:Fur family ferric uptake transcriptional regulator